MSTNYSTIATLDQKRFNELIFKYTHVLGQFKERIYDYDDKQKLFREKSLSMIPYFAKLDEALKHDVLFSLQQEHFERHAFLFKTDDIASDMFIVESGVVEILTTIDGVEFSIEKLYRGSVINHKSFLFKERIECSARCCEPVTLLYLNFDTL